MNDAERSALLDVLVGYFGDNTTGRGVREMLGVTRTREDLHARYRGALEAGLRAARAGDEDIVPVVRELAPLLPDVAAAEELLASILTEYDRQYG